MRIIEITEGKLRESRMLQRTAYVVIADNINLPGHLDIISASFSPRAGHQKIIVKYPQYVAGTRAGEASYVHLPSYPERILHRLHRAINA